MGSVPARFRLLAILWLAIAACAPWASAGDGTQQAVSPQDLIGTYQGQLSSGGVMRDVTTTFFLDAKGNLAGTYEYEEDTGPQSGKLIKPQFDASGEITFIWQDDFGFGTLTIAFSPDLSGFVGAWSTLEDTSEAFPWFGKRIKE